MTMAPDQKNLLPNVASISNTTNDVPFSFVGTPKPKLRSSSSSGRGRLLRNGGECTEKPLPEIENQLKVSMVAIHHLGQALFAGGVTLDCFQRLFFMLFLGCADVGVVVFAGFVEFIGIAPQR